MKKSLILASSSPRRIEMLMKHGIEPRIIKPEVDEKLPQGISMQDAVMYLALKKALAAERRVLNLQGDDAGEKDGRSAGDDSVIIAADTVVYKNKIIGKPNNEEHAREIFELLRDTDHLVATGVAILETGGVCRRVFCQVTRVFFRDYRKQDITDYIASGELWDKAGGYAIQGGFAQYIDHISGDYDNVVGFPWTRIQEELSEMGLEV